MTPYFVRLNAEIRLAYGIDAESALTRAFGPIDCVMDIDFIRPKKYPLSVEESLKIQKNMIERRLKNGRQTYVDLFIR